MIYANIACDMPRDPRMLAAGWQARAVYTEALLYCRENLTDGVIDRLTIVCWMPDMPQKMKVGLLDRLADVGALECLDKGWKWPDKVWQTWNPTKADIEEMRDKKSKAGGRGNHERWHTGKNAKPRPNCEWCVEASQNDRTVRQGANRTGSPEPETEGKPEPETEGKESPQSHNGSSSVAIDPAGGDSSSRQQEVIAHYVRLGVQGMEDRAQPIKSDTGIRAHFTEQAKAHDKLALWCDLFPTAPADAVAAWLHGDKGSMRYYPRADELATVTELRPA